MRFRLRHYVIMALIPVVFFILLDLVLRLAGINPYEKETLSPQFSRSVSQLYKKSLLAHGQEGYVKAVPWDDPDQFQPIPAHKPEKTFYIFTLGGSAPTGFPFPARAAFSQWLKAGLESVYPEWTFHVVNAAHRGIPLRIVAVILKETLNYQPDLIIIYSGNNEYRNLKERITVLRNSDICTSLLRICWKLRSFQVLHYLLIGQKPSFDWKFAMADSKKKIPVHSADERSFLLENYKDGLRAIYQMASGAKVPLVFCTVPVNEKDWPPYESVLSMPLPESEAMTWKKSIRLAFYLNESHRQREARKVCLKLLKQDKHYALVHFLLGKGLEQMGQYNKAREEYQVALEEDQAHMRAFGSLNRSLVNFCKARSIPVADCIGCLRRNAPNGLLGFDQFLDNCHFMPEEHRLISREIARAIMETGVLPAPPDNWQKKFDNGLTQYDKQLVFTKKETAAAHLNTAKALLEGLTYRIDSESFSRAEKELKQAIKTDPELCTEHFYLGVMYFLMGDPDRARVEWLAELKNCPRFSITQKSLDLLTAGRLSREMLLQKSVFNLAAPQPSP